MLILELSHVFKPCTDLSKLGQGFAQRQQWSLGADHVKG